MTQTRALETLRARRQEGKFPVVKVGPDNYEFVGVAFGGSSPTVSLVSPSGEIRGRTVAEWKKLGAEFKARSRSLPRSYLPPDPRASDPKPGHVLKREVDDWLRQHGGGR